MTNTINYEAPISLTKDVTLATPEDMRETLPQFKDVEDLKEFVSNLDTFSLEYIVKSLHLPLNPTSHSGIHRMRLSLALQKYMFPPLPNNTKAKVYNRLSDDTLYMIAEDLKLAFDKTNNPIIDRMHIIASLLKLR